jgi:hypothetical protein
MSETRIDIGSHRVRTYAGPMVADYTRRLWQLTDAVTGMFVTMSDDQWWALMAAIREAEEHGWPPVGA